MQTSAKFCRCSPFLSSSLEFFLIQIRFFPYFIFYRRVDGRKMFVGGWSTDFIPFPFLSFAKRKERESHWMVLAREFSISDSANPLYLKLGNSATLPNNSPSRSFILTGVPRLLPSPLLSFDPRRCPNSFTFLLSFLSAETGKRNKERRREVIVVVTKRIKHERKVLFNEARVEILRGGEGMKFKVGGNSQSLKI